MAMCALLQLSYFRSIRSLGGFGKVFSFGKLWNAQRNAEKEKRLQITGTNTPNEETCCAPSLLLPNSDDSRRSAHDSMALWALFISRRDARQLLLHDVRKLLHLALHLDHLFAHVQDDFDACEVHAHIASQRQNNVQALQIAVGV